MEGYYTRQDLGRIFDIKPESTKQASYIPKCCLIVDGIGYWSTEKIHTAVKASRRPKAIFAIFGNEIHEKIKNGSTYADIRKEYGVSNKSIAYNLRPDAKERMKSISKSRHRPKVDMLKKEYRAPKFYDLVFQTLNKSINQEIFQ